MQHKYSPNNTCYAEHDDDDERTPKTMFRLLHSFELQRIISSKTKTQTHREQHFSCSLFIIIIASGKSKSNKSGEGFLNNNDKKKKKLRKEKRKQRRRLAVIVRLSVRTAESRLRLGVFARRFRRSC